jgi:hypothetical protein
LSVKVRLGPRAGVVQPGPRRRAGDPAQALLNQVRHDIGRFPGLSAEAVQALTLQYREHPDWSAQPHHDNLRMMLAAAADSKCPSYPSVRRHLKAQGLLRQRPLRRGSEGALSNRWGGFKALRARWLDHLDSASRRPVILIDEAQEMTPIVLSELRLLASARFDSQSLLCVVFYGDARLLDKLRHEELIPLGSRIRTHLATGVATREELLVCLEHLLATAGNANLMTKQLRDTLCDHAAGNYCIFIGMAAELLMSAEQREITELDEKLYLQVFAAPQTQTPRRAAGAR